MPLDPLVVLEDDLVLLKEILGHLYADADATAVFLVSRNGEAIAAAGAVGDVDPTSLASLVAGTVAATRGLAQLVGEPEFSSLIHEGGRRHLHISTVPGGGILVLAFDERATLGLVRLRVRRATTELAECLRALSSRERSRGGARDPLAAWANLTDDEVEALFRAPGAGDGR
jgi:predicted regulator of Ras-like GTPase activity (Roadblock/LC7/MglB family)